MTSLDLFCQEKITKLEQEKKLRSLKDFKFSNDLKIELEGKKYHNFASNDYYGLAQNQEVKQAAKRAIDQYGVGGTSSRLVVGNYDLYSKLEEKIANYKDTESALVFGSGYLASISIIPALFDKNDLVIADRLVHACLLDGIALSGAKLLRYRHNDLEHVESLLESESNKYKKVVLVTETVFSMDGDKGQINDLIHLAKKYQAILISDDAHGLGVNDKFISFEDHLQLGTMSKGLGVYGGYVAGSKLLCKYLATKGRGFVYTTSLPVPVVAAAEQAFTLLQRGEVIKRLKENVEYFAQESGLKSFSTPIFVKEFETIEKMQLAQKNLLKQGFYVAGIRPPTCPSARLRISISAGHTKDVLQGLAKLCS